MRSVKCIFIFAGLLFFAGCGGQRMSRSVFISDVDPDGVFGATNILSDGEKQVEFLEFCAAPHGDAAKAVTRVYLSAGWHGLEQVSVDDKELRRFIRQAHEAGIEVYNCQGYYRWATPSGQAQAVQIIDNVLRFNKDAEPTERFDGILLDIEPFVLNESNGDPLDWGKDHKEIWRVYLEVLDQIAERVRAYKASTWHAIRLGECIPDFYEQEGVPAVEGVSYRDVIDRVDFTWLMCYRNTKELIVEMSQDEIRYAAEADKPIVLGLCVNRPTPSVFVTEYNTYWDEGVAVLEQTIESLREYYNDSYPLKEVSLFSYIHYKEMQP